MTVLPSARRVDGTKARRIVGLLMLSVVLPAVEPAPVPADAAQGAAAVEIDGVRLSMVVSEPHPFLPDHQKAIEARADGRLIVRHRSHADLGNGSPAFVFAGDDGPIVIDCDGHWYEFDRSGNLVRRTWRWEAPLPKAYFGRFEYQDARLGYRFVPGNAVRPGDVYLAKDPG